jgi:hypothetical protein
MGLALSTGLSPIVEAAQEEEDNERETAVKSAHLLNTARRSASTTVSPNPVRTRGRLKRPTFVAQNLSKATRSKDRKDPYDLSFSSPEKPRASLVSRMRNVSLLRAKISRGRGRPRSNLARPQAPASPDEHEPVEEPTARLSPKRSSDSNAITDSPSPAKRQKPTVRVVIDNSVKDRISSAHSDDIQPQKDPVSESQHQSENQAPDEGVQTGNQDFHDEEQFQNQLDERPEEQPEEQPEQRLVSKQTRGNSKDRSDSFHLTDSSEDESDNHADEHSQSEPSEPVPQALALDRIRDFTKEGRILGTCQTSDGREILRACRMARELYASEEINIDECRSSLENLSKMLHAFAARERRRAKRKTDAYAYLFRALGKVLLAMQSSLGIASYPDEESHITCLEITTRFMESILVFDQSLRSWAVLPRHNGQPIIQKARQGLIVPLRDLLNDHSRELKERIRQRNITRSRKVRLESEARRLEQAKRTAEMLKFQREKRKRWQDLHIARIKCEPDAFLFDHLRLKAFPDTQELDANGEMFERIELFKTRTSPPGNVMDTEGQTWKDEERIALLDGLRAFTGTS